MIYVATSNTGPVRHELVTLKVPVEGLEIRKDSYAGEVIPSTTVCYNRSGVNDCEFYFVGEVENAGFYRVLMRAKDPQAGRPLKVPATTVLKQAKQTLELVK